MSFLGASAILYGVFIDTVQVRYNNGAKKYIMFSSPSPLTIVITVAMCHERYVCHV